MDFSIEETLSCGNKYTTELDKKILLSKTSLEKQCRITSGFQFINFDFLTGGQERAKFSLRWNFEFFSRYFVFVVYILCVHHFFKIIEQAPGHNYKNTIFQPEQCPFNVMFSFEMRCYLNLISFAAIR